MSLLYKKIRKNLVGTKETIEKGGANCVSTLFTKFKEESPGIRKKFYYLVSEVTKSSKIQLTNFLFVITPIFYYLHNSNKIKFTIHTFPLVVKSIIKN